MVIKVNTNSSFSSNKRAQSSVFAKRKPAFKVRIDSMRQWASSPTTTTTRPNKKTKKTVQFAENRNTVLFRHVMDSELQQAWYQSKDYCDFQKESRATLDALRRARGHLTVLDAKEHCIRGLEAHVSDDVLQLRKTRIRSAVQVVLDQQNMQRIHGVKDTVMLASVSTMFSHQSRRQALSMGALDDALRRC